MRRGGVGGLRGRTKFFQYLEYHSLTKEAKKQNLEVIRTQYIIVKELDVII